MPTKSSAGRGANRASGARGTPDYAATERQPLLAVLFEVTSAFGTVGLSMGLTPELTAFGKLLLILLMFTGRLGAFTLAYALQPKKKKELFHYPEEKIIIG